ncbi:ABC-type iron transport system FetAB, permease component [Nocardioides alpinus]|uniref:ABC-type iron transport system FetAB, permease component n=1 Tax=Nocardioides alpinus TaxID=748909 RepID=A0A1I1B713_9ACTN|nr:transglutaminase domain-containing protein [Nocardioides alpinus]PKH41376.1 hypothetical protein CXG46_09840 [Nocardioides alpinus]SFB45456.1 ABC-type iron transport system FetAB, permease component [Nocardioides alpinus]
MNQRRGTLLDLAMILFLMSMVLSILDNTFADRSYLLTGLLPVVLLLVLALLTRRLHEGVWWYALGAVLLFAPLGAVVALRRLGPYVLPTFETMNRVLGESFSAPTTLVSTVPPVDPTGQVMLVPFMLGFLAGAPAAWLALSTRRALAPTIPLVLALGATIPLGVLVPSLLVPRSIVFAVVLVAWAAARARRREALVGRPRGSVAAALTAVLTVTLVSGLVSLLVPDRNEVDRVLLKGDGNSALVAGAAQSVVPRRVGRRNELLRATGVPEGRRLRFAALDTYDGTAWVPAEESPGTDGFGTFKRIGQEVAAPHEGRTVGVRVQIRPGYASDWLPMLGELTSLTLDYTDGRTQLDDVRYNQATSSALVVGGVNTRDDYTFGSVLTEDEFTRRDATQDATEDQQQPDGAFLDQYLQAFRREEIRPIERVLLLARYLRLNGSTRFVGSSSQAPVDLGLRLLGSEQMTATPFQYTAVMALGASRLGVPARVVTGAEPDARGVVDYDDVTSWVELQFADGTWRTLDPSRYVGVHLVADGVEPVDPGGFVQEQLEAAAKGKDKEIRIPKGTPVTLPEGTAIGQPTSTWQIALRVVGAALMVVLVVLLLVPVAKVLRRGRRRRTSSWSGTYVNGWQEVLDAARDRGTPVPDAWSRVAQARQLGAGIELARQADAAVFAPGPGDVEDSRRFWDACLDLRGELVAQVDARHRLWSRFNPASLLAGWARSRTRPTSGLRQVRDEDRRPRSQQPAGA